MPSPFCCCWGLLQAQLLLRRWRERAHKCAWSPATRRLCRRLPPAAGRRALPAWQFTPATWPMAPLCAPVQFSQPHHAPLHAPLLCGRLHLLLLLSAAMLACLRPRDHAPP